MCIYYVRIRYMAQLTYGNLTNSEECYCRVHWIATWWAVYRLHHVCGMFMLCPWIDHGVWYTHSGRNNVRSSVSFWRLFLNWSHYSMWSVRVTDHVCMVAQQLCSRRYIVSTQTHPPFYIGWGQYKMADGSGYETRRYTRWKASSSVPCYWVQLFYTFLVSRGSLTDC